jgi:16S rRNA (guanine527-N7)-methyltransferase
MSSDCGAFPLLPEWADLWQASLSWVPTAAQRQQFQTLYELILAGNQQLNLTRITEPTEFLEKHLWDSLSGIQKFLVSAVPADAIAPLPAPPLKAIDIGTGAGFPGIPIAIVQPHWSVTLLDSTRKKLTFLDQTLQTMNLPNAKTLVGRVEEMGQTRQHRGQYDLALIRAVAGATVCAEYTLPLLKVQGEAVLYRGQWTVAEEQALTLALEQLGGTIQQVTAFKTPISHSDRHCIYLQKTRPTPAEFPRLTGIPSQKPLGVEEEQR